ncbi:MAG: tetratricopeptide repeat protein [Anaerolineales bacterium]|nr:tetratricopeptide repeat protein [Anaerolineales bacterium]
MPGKRDTFEQAMSRGHSAAWEQQWDRAIAYYRAALTEFPDDTAALTALGFALFQADKLEEALGTYQRAASLMPGDPVAPEKCGEIFERLGRVNEAAQTYLAVAEIHLQHRDVQKAIDNWSRVARLTPDNLNARSRLALALERTSQNRAAALEYVEVARIFQRAREVEKTGQAVQRALQLEPQSPEAREAFEKLKRNQPIPPASKAGAPKRQTGMLTPPAEPARPAAPAAPAALGTGELGAAQASPLDAARDLALASLAELLFEEDADTSRVTTSVSALTRGGLVRDAQNQRAQAVMYLGQALSAQTAGNKEGAASHFAAALDSGLDHPLIHFVLGVLLLDLRRPPDAIDHFQAAVAREDIKLGVLYGLGESYRQTNQMRPALTYLMEALKRLDMQLIAPERQDRLVEAYESLSETLSRAADADIARIVPGVKRFLSGDGWEARAQQARRQLDTAAEGGQVMALAEELATTPGTDEVLDAMHRIDEYVRRKLYATAMEEAFWALEHSPTYLPVHIRMAEILVAEHKPETAAIKYKVVANTYQIRGEANRAARLLGQVLKLNPVDIDARAQLIRLLMDQGKTEEALTQHVELADTYRDLADLDAAREQYVQANKYALSANAREWSVRLLHAMCDIDMQRLAWREAVRGYEQIKALAPNDEKARIALVDLYFRLGNQRQAVADLDAYLKQLIGQRALPAATTLLEELLNNHPDDPALVARLARLYLDQGRKEDAITRYDQLGDIQLQAGQNDQAMETIRTILGMNPADPTPYQQLLAQLQQQG